MIDIDEESIFDGNMYYIAHYSANNSFLFMLISDIDLLAFNKDTIIGEKYKIDGPYFSLISGLTHIISRLQQHRDFDKIKIEKYIPFEVSL